MDLRTATVRLGARRVLVARPNERQYGHLGLEIVMSLAHARKERADIVFVRPSTGLGSGLFELESRDVRVLRPLRVIGPLLRSLASWKGFVKSVGRWRGEVREQLGREFVRAVAPYVADPGIPEDIRRRLRDARQRLRTSLDQEARDRRQRTPYYERRLIREPLPVQLRPAARDEAIRQARAHGISPDMRLVCIHSREPGYKKGAELQDSKPDGRDDGTRNARIESYLSAVDHLVQRGYTVVRLGDPSMTPLQHRGVVDLATSPGRTNLLEVYCLLYSDFIICGESAFVNVVSLTNTPMLVVNATEPISSYPLRAPGLLLPKTVVDKRTDRRLTSLDMLTFDYHRQFRDPRRYQYVDNSPEQIRAATIEMLEWIEGTWTESESQRGFHEAIVAAAGELWERSQFIRKWGLDEGFLGDGRIARVAVTNQ